MLCQGHTQVRGRAKLETSCLATNPFSFHQCGKLSHRVALSSPKRSEMRAENSTMSGAETGVIGPREELGCFLEMDVAVEAME